MNLRAVGCGALAIVAFLAIGLLGLSRSFAPAECPRELPYEPAPYRPTGAPAERPTLPGVEGDLELAGGASFGLARWDVWVERGTAPTASGEVLPQRVVLDCRDGTFQSYQRASS